MNKPETLGTTALSIKALQNLEKLAWPKGAKVFCSVCLKAKEKTPEQMRKLLEKWPKCCQKYIEVRPL